MIAHYRPALATATVLGVTMLMGVVTGFVHPEYAVAVGLPAPALSLGPEMLASDVRGRTAWSAAMVLLLTAVIAVLPGIVHPILEAGRHGGRVAGGCWW